MPNPPTTAAASSTDQPVSLRKALAAWLAIVLVPLAVLVDTGLALARGWQLESRLDRAVLVALVTVVAIVTLVFAWPAGRRMLSRFAPQLILLVGSCLVAWTIAESGLGPIVARSADPFHLRRPNSSLVYHPREGTMRDVGDEANVNFNSLGIRGSEMPDRSMGYRILCLGGSTTLCTYLDDSKTWPQLLEDELNSDDADHQVWVGNAGMPGYNTTEHLRFIESSPVIEQLDALVMQVGINDFMLCLAGSRPAPPLWTHSRVWNLLRAVTRLTGSSGTQVEDTAGTVYLRRRAERQAAPRSDDPPNLEPCLAEFRDRLNKIIDAASSHHVRLVFTTQPVLWQADLDEEDQKLLWFGHRAGGSFLSVDQLRAGMDQYNQVLTEVCQQRNVELIDLSELNGDPAMFYDDCHFTETGAAAVASRVADWFKAHPAPAQSDETQPAAVPSVREDRS